MSKMRSICCAYNSVQTRMSLTDA